MAATVWPERRAEAFHARAERPNGGAQGLRTQEGAVSAVTGIVTFAIIVIVWALFALDKLDILSAVGRTP